MARVGLKTKRIGNKPNAATAHCRRIRIIHRMKLEGIHKRIFPSNRGIGMSVFFLWHAGYSIGNAVSAMIRTSISIDRSAYHGGNDGDFVDEL